ncbi:DUF456 domain-containing protein [Psychroserpens sp.]|uniref:DUF456 domain-containing protein n=1 Tax=Psychroserpens sp. TaxID=2020870 RepID=UPI001B080771|nr:DUF456 domain-containing protein [Psychroserpens sp.]MBO6605684.1 DUF456 domain-containing protein [Psychroserpens sp.]MBO6630589.1 DUF456 domain-containing protein [Psychroserpens sp.]MBO6652945.1 DUF456 domain-containing protein [Psychroserpens sp.]MBO6681283.1 DUF456 domain-containing protein [Psychroserpens sp.]MBO6749058.1 DUF456 domain-containing protein [Psychroserpens sp.]
MDIILVIVAALLMILGIIGSFLPILPGPLTSWVGLLVFHLTDVVPMNWTFLIITFIIALAIWILDYIIPAMGTKRYGGSKAGMIGTTIGLLVGLFSPIPGGIIIGPFFGALIGELIYKSDFDKAVKAAFGSFIGFIASTFIKFVVAIIFLGLFLSKFFEYSGAIF